MKTQLLSFIAVTAILVSCSSNGSKKITPTSTDFSSGEIAKYVEIVDQPSELSFTEKKGSIATQYIRLKVALRMKKDGFKSVDAHDIQFTKLLAVATIKLVDKDGFNVQELDLKSEEILKLKKLLTGNKGTTVDIIFEGQFHNHKDSPIWFKDAAQFTPYLSGGISCNTNQIMNLSGSIAGAPVHMTLHIVNSDGTATGRYYYDKQHASGNTASMKVFGNISDGDFEFTEFVKEDKITGKMSGRLSNNKYQGAFTRAKDMKEFRFSLKVDDVEENYFAPDELDFDIPSVDFEDYTSDNDDSYSSRGSSDWDELLDEYERCMKKCISLSKRMQNGEDVYEEYLEYSLQLAELGSKLENADDDMSYAQMERLSKIQLRIASELSTLNFN